MGTFSMGCSKNDSDCAIDEKPLHDVMLSEYWIDRYEVTVSDYASCVDSGICSIPKKAPEPACNYGVSGRDGFPMNCIDYKSAQRYCGWAEKTLPTEAQWEKAARGEYTWIYPWGDAPPASCDMAIMYDPKFAAAGCGTGMSWQGASLNVESPYGAFDMAGNVWEWVSDWYDATYYQTSPSIDPTGPGEGDFIVIRGGAWDDKDVRTSKRGSINPSSMLDNTGFRCAFIKK
jgi:formylglycine-generating enzyme required for sulfatase activity